jgi:RNA polymerase sigma-70 factor, ECF subfamily
VGRPLAIEEETALEDSLLREQRGRVLRLCRLLLPDRDEAEDAAQETLMKLVREIRAGNPPRSPAPWLATVAVRACRDRRRSRWWSWWQRSGEEMGDVVGEAPTPEDELLTRAGECRIFAAFRALSARQREVFVLRHVQGFSTAETAAALALDTGTVKRHLFRAVTKLRAELGGRTA